MESQFGIRGNGYVLLASDMNAARSIVKMKGDEDKMRKIGTHTVLAYNGEPGDTTQFTEYITANLQLAHFRNNFPTSPKASASWIRNQLATSIRSRSPKSVNLLLAGFDTAKGTPHLYWIDYLGTIAEVPYAAHGYGSYFCLSTLDRFHDPDAGWEKGVETLKRCINELQTRFIINLGQWNCRVVTKDGIMDVDLGTIPAPAGAPTQAADSIMEASQQAPAVQA